MSLPYRNSKLKLDAIDSDVDVNVAPDMVVRVDEYHFQNVIRNLIDNAVKYRKENLHLSISARENEKDVVVAIQDNGVGVKLADQKRVFSRFFSCKIS